MTSADRGGKDLSSPHVSVQLLYGAGVGQILQLVLLHHGEGKGSNAASGRGDTVLTLHLQVPVVQRPARVCCHGAGCIVLQGMHDSRHPFRRGALDDLDRDMELWYNTW